MEETLARTESFRIYVTKNTEYHVDGDRCVAVRDRRTRSWRREHIALHKRIRGSFRLYANGSLSVTRGLPRLGEVLYFEGSLLVTTPIEAINTPDEERLEHARRISA